MSVPSTDPLLIRASKPRQDYLRLGASLYMPATRGDLREVLVGNKLPTLRSAVVCTEDAVHPTAVAKALGNLRQVLPTLPDFGPLRFVRPRDPEVLATIVRMAGAENIHGVCLPKLDEVNVEDYLSVLQDAPWLSVMPIIETDVAFCLERLARLRGRLDGVKERILCMRIGGNDLLQLLGMKRPADISAYDTPLRLVIDHMIVTFRPHGYSVSAPVYEHIERMDILAHEMRLDVVHGLFAKTAIHPTQISLIESAYAVAPEDAALADAVLDPQAASVFRINGQMAEPATHSRWAALTRARQAVYGLAGEAASTSRGS